jgi:hypothetical protein
MSLFDPQMTALAIDHIDHDIRVGHYTSFTLAPEKHLLSHVTRRARNLFLAMMAAVAIEIIPDLDVSGGNVFVTITALRTRFLQMVFMDEQLAAIINRIVPKISMTTIAVKRIPFMMTPFTVVDR